MNKNQIKPGQIIKPKNNTLPIPIVKPYEEGKDNPDHIIGEAYRDYFNKRLMVLDFKTGIHYMIVEEDN